MKCFQISESDFGSFKVNDTKYNCTLGTITFHYLLEYYLYLKYILTFKFNWIERTNENKNRLITTRVDGGGLTYFSAPLKTKPLIINHKFYTKLVYTGFKLKFLKNYPFLLLYVPTLIL